MNFLGHAYVAKNYPQFIAGNFAGDSFKGKIEKFDYLPKDIYNGIRLHRFIDHYTDQHDDVKEVVKVFWREGVEKVSFIASDIILDHHISRLWPHYYEKSYEEFVNFVYHHTDEKANELPERFQYLYGMLKEYGWLFDYPTIEGIDKILRQFGRRIKFDNEMAAVAEIYEKNMEWMDERYKSFMIEIERDAEKFIRDNLL